MSSAQQFTDSTSEEGVPLLQQQIVKQKEQQQQQEQQQPTQTIVMPPGSYGAAGGTMPGPQFSMPPGPNVAAAAAAAMQQQQMMMQNQPQQPPVPPQYYFQGYPGALPGAVPTLPPGYPQPHMQYMQFNGPPPPAPPSRPPRHERRRSDGKSPSPSPSPPNGRDNQKTFPLPPQQQQRSEPVQSSIPPLQDIFSNQTGTTSTTNYGSISSNTNVNTTGNKVYNAPPRSSNTNPSSSGGKSRVQPMLIRTNSSGNIAATGKSKQRRMHRRSASDTPLGRPMHRRVGSGELPPKGPRGRSFSASNEDAGSTAKRGHRRIASFDHSVGSMVSQSSVSVVSNISKSAMFGGVDAGGRVQLHFPLEAIRLRFVNDDDGAGDSVYQKKKKKKKGTLTIGHLYMYRNATDFERYDEYIRLSDDIEQGVTPQWESLGLGKQQPLPEINYALPVGESVYKKVVGEIADAHNMPCGLYFCGHHEDVAFPSIQIAVVLVTILFVALIYAAFVTDFLN